MEMRLAAINVFEEIVAAKGKPTCKNEEGFVRPARVTDHPPWVVTEVADEIYAECCRVSEE